MGLVTFQGAEVLDYRLVELKTGDNELAIPMTARLVPNFDLSVAVMTDGQREKEEGRAGGGRRPRPKAGGQVKPRRSLPRGQQPVSRRARPARDDRRQAEARLLKGTETRRHVDTQLRTRVR